MAAADSAPLLAALAACYGDLRDYLQRRFGDAGLADDVVQDIWVKLRTSGAHGMVNNPRAYVFRMATNLALDHLRAERIRTQYVGEESSSEVEAPSGGGPAELIDARQRLDLVRAAVAELPPRCRQVFEMHKFDGMPHKEIAERLGISRNMVEKHVIRGLARCRQCLADAAGMGGEPPR